MVVPTTVQFHLINSLFNLIPTLQRSMLYVTQHMTKDAYQNFKEVLSIFPIKYPPTYSIQFHNFFFGQNDKSTLRWHCDLAFGDRLHALVCDIKTSTCSKCASSQLSKECNYCQLQLFVSSISGFSCWCVDGWRGFTVLVNLSKCTQCHCLIAKSLQI